MILPVNHFDSNPINASSGSSGACRELPLFSAVYDAFQQKAAKTAKSFFLRDFRVFLFVPLALRLNEEVVSEPFLG
jgi:hypothetical protein